MNPKRLQQLENLTNSGLTKPVEAMDLPVNINLFLHGDHGVGKTVAACAIAGARGKVLLYTMHEDWKSLKNTRHRAILENTVVMRHANCFQTSLVAEAIREQIPPYDQYAGFVFDTVGDWVTDFVGEMMRLTEFSSKTGRTKVNPRPNKPEAKDFIADLDLTVGEQSDYNIAMHKLRPILDNLVKAPISVVLNAHTRKADAEREKLAVVDMLRPDMPEGTFGVCARRCDALGHFTHTKQYGRRIQFTKDETVATKSRLDVLEGKTLPVDKAVEEIIAWCNR